MAWIKEKIPDGLFADFSAHPGRLENMIPPEFTGWVIIDEVQKIPALLDEVHRLIENRKLRFVLTGSSPRSLRKKGVNLLAGRALSFHMFRMTAVELGLDFNIQKSLKFGHLPYAISSVSTKSAEALEAYLEAYAGIYLKEEVMQEALTRNVGAFSRFLEAASFSQASLINMSEIARETSLTSSPS